MDILEGSYATYKRATSNFLSWIRTASKGKNSSLTEKSSLSHIEDAVSAIYENFRAVGKKSISQTLWESLPGALRSCKKAIEIRKAVGLIYEKVNPEDVSNTTHKHFVSSLEGWHTKLSKLSQMKLPPPTEANSQKIANIYENLCNLDDVEDSDDQTGPTTTLPKKNVSVKPASEEAFNEQFEKDLQLTLLCLLLDIEENMKRVVECWIGVKNGTETIITATVVTIAAIKLVKGLEATLQLRYPAFKDFESIHNGGLCTYIPNVSERCHQYAFAASIQYMTTKSLSFLPGCTWGEIKEVAQALASFSRRIPSDGSGLHLKAGSFGEVYSEGKNPLWSMFENTLCFLCQQLPTYYNIYCRRGNLSLFEDYSLSSCFLNILKECFETKVVTLTAAFAVTCWLKSIMALQGNLFLGRCIYYSKEVITDLYVRLSISLESQQSNKGDKDLLETLQLTQGQWHYLIQYEFTTYCSCNPLLAGLFMIDAIFQYLSLGCQSLNKTSTFQAFGHLYHAMLDRQKLVESVPFLDDVQQIFKRSIYSASPPEHGRFLDAYLLSSHQSVSSVVAVKKGKKSKAKTGNTKQRRGIHIQDLSVVYRALILQDYSCIVSRNCHHDDLEEEHILDLLARLARYEQFQSRVLARDILSMNDYITMICDALIEGLNLQPKFKAFLADPQMRRASPQWARDQAIENVLMTPLLLMFDYVTQDGNDFDLVGYESYASKMNAVTKYRLTIESGKSAILQCLSNQTKIIAEVITTMFASKKIQKTLFFLSTSRTPTLDDFGISLANAKPKRHNGSLDALDNVTYTSDSQPVIDINDDMTAFNEVMDLIEEAKGSFTLDEIDRIKMLVRIFPHLLNQYEVGKPLPTVMHQVCGGVITNADLVEWLIHMNALDYQHIGIRPVSTLVGGKMVSYASCGKTPLHVAVEANNLDIVKLLVEYDQSNNLNVPTVHEGDTPIHIAIRMKHEAIADYLNLKGADLFVKNKKGKLMYQEAPKSSKNKWKKAYDQKVSSAAQNMKRGDRTNQFTLESIQNLERVNQMLEEQKIEECNTNTHTNQRRGGQSRPISSTASTMSSSSTVVNQAESILQTHETI